MPKAVLKRFRPGRLANKKKRRRIPLKSSQMACVDQAQGADDGHFPSLGHLIWSKFPGDIDVSVRMSEYSSRYIQIFHPVDRDLPRPHSPPWWNEVHTLASGARAKGSRPAATAAADLGRNQGILPIEMPLIYQAQTIGTYE